MSAIETPAVVVPPVVAAPAAPKPGTPEHAAAMASLAPANVPDKFKNADGTVNVAALTDAYKALEVRQSTTTPPPATVTPPVDLDAAFKTPVVAPATDAWKSAQAELAAEGKISDATRTVLKTANVPDAVIDGMIAGHAAQRQAIGTNLATAAGGVENLNKAILHARKTMNDTQLAALRTTLEGPTGSLVIAGLVAQMNAANPAPRVEPKSVILDGASMPGGEPVAFTSNSEMLAAFRDPRYAADPKYREYCGRRMLAGQRTR